MSASQTIGLALSGGGFRASAFHIGVLKRLEELGVLRHLALVSTVSGGSIVGALYALRCAEQGDGAPGSYPVDLLHAEVRQALVTNVRGQALFGSPIRLLRTALSLVAPWGSRMPLLVRQLDGKLYEGARLPDLPPWIVINATNLATGKGWKFFHDCAGDYLIGATDQTSRITVAEAVGASAAYPFLVDPFPFRTRWEHLQGGLLDGRWERPPTETPGGVSRWRDRFGRQHGDVVLPLVDGGIYDNEGLNSLRGARISHAIISSTAPPPSGFSRTRGLRVIRRVAEVMHSRLGDVTRQHAHEMTHGMPPGDARRELLEIAAKLRAASDDSVEAELGLNNVAERLDGIAGVGWPPRGHQFTATAPILLHRTDVANNLSATYKDDPYDIPAEERGLVSSLVEEIARVRTDLDALEPAVFNLLVAQGYFLTDASLKISMPNLLSECANCDDPRSRALRPSWELAHATVRSANANRQDAAQVLNAAIRRRVLGRAGTAAEAFHIWVSVFAAVASILVVLVFLAWLVA